MSPAKRRRRLAEPNSNPCRPDRHAALVQTQPRLLDRHLKKPLVVAHGMSSARLISYSPGWRVKVSE